MPDKINLSSGLLRDVEKYVIELLTRGLPENICYHTIEHTKYVVEGIDIIGRNSGLSEDELMIARISGWFHDTGYTVSTDNHEHESVIIARDYLQRKNTDPAIILQVEKSILATIVPQSPEDRISETVCDADLRHLADAEYYRFVKLMRCEMKKLSGKELSELEFDKMSVEFFRKHHYHTEYGKKVLEEGKRKNLQKILKNISKSET